MAAQITKETKPLLEIDQLNIGFDTSRGQLRPVRDVSYSIFPGQTLAVVGESGCGKSVTALSILRLIPSLRAGCWAARFDLKIAIY